MTQETTEQLYSLVKNAAEELVRLETVNENLSRQLKAVQEEAEDLKKQAAAKVVEPAVAPKISEARAEALVESMVRNGMVLLKSAALVRQNLVDDQSYAVELLESLVKSSSRSNFTEGSAFSYDPSVKNGQGESDDAVDKIRWIQGLFLGQSQH